MKVSCISLLSHIDLIHARLPAQLFAFFAKTRETTNKGSKKGKKSKN